MPTRLQPVTAASIAHAPPPCVGCVFWQSRSERAVAKGKWAERMEDDWGPWGTLYYDDGDRLLGFIASKGDRDLMVVETSRGAEQTVSTAKYEVTSRGGKGRELLQRGSFTRVVPPPPVVVGPSE